MRGGFGGGGGCWCGFNGVEFLIFEGWVGRKKMKVEKGPI